VHAVYSALLACLTLSSAHRADLRRRGLTDAEIDRLGYRTLPVQRRAPRARDLRERFGDKVLRVPGIITRERDGKRNFTLAGKAGMLIPVRNVQGRIVALKIRDESDGRYSYLSSTKYGGPGPGAPVHVPLGIQVPTKTGRWTEGELKADIAFAKTGLPTISAPGVSNGRLSLPVMKALGWQTVRLAIDGDARDNPTVARALDGFTDALADGGFAIELERWPAEYKGIDDALAAGAPIEVLAGDDARHAIAEIVAEGTAGEPPHEASPLDRLPEIFAAGAESLFRDRELLQALAQLAEANPAEFNCCRAQAKNAGLSLRDLDSALSPLRQEIRAANPPLTAVGEYRITAGRFVHIRSTQQGPVEVPLCNFSARIVETIRRDDGAEATAAFGIEGALMDGRPLPKVIVKASEFPRMEWVTPAWHGLAVVFAGPSTRDHLRCAIELLSPDRAQRVEYLHTGWRKVGEHWVYLHAAGAIGMDGPVEGIVVSLPAAFSRFELPTPPEGKRLVDAVRASLRIFDLGPCRLIFPLFSAVYRAVLGLCDFGLHICGPTGVFKSEAASLFQQHFGAGMDRLNLPASWASTANSNEALAFAAKEALLVVDDFAPTGSAADVQRSHRDADRLFRAQGNAAGRARCRSDATLVQDKPPRGLITSTGEDIPRGQSLRARLLLLELSAGSIDPVHLTACQRDAAAGLYAEALAAFLRWLASRYQGIRDGLRAEVASLREKALAGTAHRRTPEIVANLFIGLKYFLEFAEETGAITAQEKAELLQSGWEALGDAAATQSEHVAAAEPCEHFVRLMSGALASGRAHFANSEGDRPADAGAWGWRKSEIRTGDGSDRWEAQGRRIGWVDAAGVYLEPDAAFAAVQEMARDQEDSLPISPRTLWQRLRDRGFLVNWEGARGRNTIRRTLGGIKDRTVLHLSADFLSTGIRASESSARPSEACEKGKKRPVAADGSADDRAVGTDGLSAETAGKTANNDVGGQSGRSQEGEEDPVPKKLDTTDAFQGRSLSQENGPYGGNGV
jgi:hypothetical protein